MCVLCGCVCLRVRFRQSAERPSLRLANTPAWTDTHTAAQRISVTLTQPGRVPLGYWPLTHTHTRRHTCSHTCTHISEINFNSLVREQISRQPFISSASSTLPLRCTLLHIDPRHSLVVHLSYAFVSDPPHTALRCPSRVFSSSPWILSSGAFPLTSE